MSMRKIAATITFLLSVCLAGHALQLRFVALIGAPPDLQAVAKIILFYTGFALLGSAITAFLTHGWSRLTALVPLALCVTVLRELWLAWAVIFP
jgi:hypothetical protein